MEDLLDSIDGLRRATSLPAIEGELTALLGRHGFDRYIHYTVRAPLVEIGRNPFVSNFPKEWQVRYAERSYSRVDPVMHASYERMMPFTWNEAIAGRPLSRPARAMMGEAAEHGLRGGLSVPIFGPSGRLSVLSVVSSEREVTVEEYMTQHRLLLYMVALHAYDAIEQAAAATEAAPVGPEDSVVLYPRERECLLWAAKGKKSWEIGQILGISNGTVDQYLKSAARKLQVFGRQHAVARAVKLGLIQP